MIDQNSQFYAILTNIGVAKQANADALGIGWKITQMGVGDANGADPQPDAKQKALINEWRRAPLNQLKQDPTNPAIIIAEQVIPAEVGGKWIREIGLYDADNDLVAVANCAPSFKPLLAQGSGRTQVVRMNLIVSNSASVELKIDPSVVLATQEFVLSELARQDFKHSVLVATTANIALSGLQTIDGVTVPAGRRVLVTKQTAARENGIYVTAASAWARAADADTDLRVTPGLLVQVEQGTVNGDSGWQLVTDGPISLGVTALSFEMAWGRTGVEPGTYRSVTVDKYGRVLGGTSPTTVAGYGLTDVYTVGQMDSALLRKANVDSPTFTGTPKAPTPAASTNSEQIATTAFVVAKIAALVGGAPGAMDALNELAAAMGNDPNFAASTANALALKAPLASPVFTGDPRAPTVSAGDNDTSVATTGFTRLCIGLFGLGTDNATTVGDANSVALAGMFRMNADAANIPLAANATLLNMRYNDGGAFQLFSALAGSGGGARLFWRTQAAGGWTVWREVGGLDSPVFTGDPKAPTAALGDNDLSLANTAFVQATLAGVGLGTVNSSLVSDLNTAVLGGLYRTNPATANQPGATSCSVEVVPWNNGGCLQTLTQLGGGSRRYWRTQASGVWTNWREVVSVDDPGLVPTTIVGSARNVIMSVASASASAVITADELIVEAGVGGMGYRLSSFNKTINLTAVGSGGMDTGAVPANGFVAIYAIYNPITGVSALLATDATSLAMGEVYTGANMPAGFTASALVSVWRIKNSLFQIGFMEGREVIFAYEKVAVTTAQITAFKSLSVASVIPLAAKAVTGWLSVAGLNTSNAQISVASAASGIGFQQVAGNSMSETVQNICTGSFSNLKVITAQTIFWLAGVLSGTFKEGAVNISGYRF